MGDSTREKHPSWPPLSASNMLTLKLVAAIVAATFTAYTIARSEVRDEVVRHDATEHSHEGMRGVISNHETRIQSLERRDVTLARIERWLDKEEERRRSEQSKDRERRRR